MWMYFHHRNGKYYKSDLFFLLENLLLNIYQHMHCLWKKFPQLSPSSLATIRTQPHSSLPITVLWQPGHRKSDQNSKHHRRSRPWALKRGRKVMSFPWYLLKSLLKLKKKGFPKSVFLEMNALPS